MFNTVKYAYTAVCVCLGICVEYSMTYTYIVHYSNQVKHIYLLELVSFLDGENFRGSIVYSLKHLVIIII